MDWLQGVVDFLDHWVVQVGIPVGGENIPFMVIMLLGTGILLTVRTGFIQVRRLGHGFAVATGRYDDPNEPGDVSHFQALTTALSATVGIGNIAGVALAIHWGGPGAVFWMWMTAVVGMATKYSEVTLAQRYRDVGPDDDPHKWEGSVSGGPMYYIERGLGPKWKPMAVFFALLLGLTAFMTGNANQANTVSDIMQSSFGVPTWITGLITSAVVAAVILGGIKRIGRVTSILAPLMAAIYVAGALIIILMNAGAIVPSIMLIFQEAFSPTAGVAGTGIGAVLVTMMWGVRRGLFSNEAGQGSAPIAHAAAKTDEPVSEGVVALLEPFIDTIVICSMTALVIITTGVWDDRYPTELQLSGGDLAYVTQTEQGGYTMISVPGADAGIAVEGGRQVDIDPGAPLISWHEVWVEELFVDPEIKLAALKVGWTLGKKALGFRYLMDVIPLDASLVKGSHGLLPRDPADGKDVILEVKAGEGGDESALFAGDLVRMYTRYAEQRGWRTEVVSATEGELGGYKDISLAVKSRDPANPVFGRLKYEGG
ncbi:MAG: amino acid carrier protein, partial [Gemmatimonadetes bacterium]|nr:amino acid carrier protein [Gemmatimonadota bacterium]